MRLNQPKSGTMAAVLVTLCGLGLGGCDALDSINPFAEKYKPEVIPDVPADKLYSEGLARMEDKDYEGASKKFGELDKAYSYSDWSSAADDRLLELRGREVRRRDQRLEALPAAPPGEQGRGLRPVPHGDVAL